MNNYPKDRKYHHEHTWTKIEGNVFSVGISFFAQEQLGEVLFIELPVTGDKITEGIPFGTIESAKVISDLISPLNGEILEVNQELENKPNLVNDDPYGQGWIVKIRVDKMSEFDNLLDAEGYICCIEQ